MRAAVDTVTNHTDQVWGVKFEGASGGVRGSLHASVSDDKSISLYNYSPLDPRVLVSGSDDECLHMYDAEGKTLFSSMSGHFSWVLSVDVSPDGAAIASGSSDRTVKLWDPKMRAAAQTMTNHTDQVWGVKFEGAGSGVRGSLLASVSDDKSISLYNYS